MLTRSQLETAEAYRQLPQVTPSDFQLLWHCDYWDGARSGLLLFHGERCWFEVFAESDDEDEPYVWWRLFAIVRLTPERLAGEERWHTLFRQKVGTHTDYDETGVRRRGELHPPERTARFLCRARQPKANESRQQRGPRLVRRAPGA